MMRPYWTCCWNSRRTPRPPWPHRLRRQRSHVSPLHSFVLLGVATFVAFSHHLRTILARPGTLLLTPRRRVPRTTISNTVDSAGVKRASRQEPQTPLVQQRRHRHEVRDVVVAVR